MTQRPLTSTACIRSMIALMALMATLMPLVAAPAQAGTLDDSRAIVESVNAINSGGNPASMIAWGAAQPLVVSPKGEVLAAASTIGNGRVVALGHGGFIRNTDADTQTFVCNALEWLAHDVDAPRIAGLTDVNENKLKELGRNFTRITTRPANLDFDDCDVIIGSPQAFAKAGRIDELDRWLRGGHGMLVTETAWGVLQLNRNLTLETLAANTLLGDAGLRFTSNAHSGYGPDKLYSIDHTKLEASNADTALAILASEPDAPDAAHAARIVGRAIRAAPLDSAFMRDALSLNRTHNADLAQCYREMSWRKLTPEKDALAIALLDLASRRATELPPTDIVAHPSHESFPGPVGPAREKHVTIDLRLATPGWQTTGLYAPPGEIVTVVLPEELAESGFVAQIGAWRDPHNHDHRVRIPNALRRYELTQESTTIASAIGGPIYIDIPAGYAKQIDTASTGAIVPISIHNAARAPHFRLGHTSVEDWINTIRHYDAPWAEFESDELIFTIPSSAVRDVTEPDRIMEHWDRVHAAMESLEPRTWNHWNDRPYRYVADASVSWGYMYCPADGPIVIPQRASVAMLLPENYDAEGKNNLWGHYHEMGHAHQNALWTDGATTEVTVNIFTVYALHVVNGYPLDSDVMRSAPDVAWKTFDEHRATGKPFEQVGGPFPRLQMYALLWHEFGFDAFHEAFDRIRAIPENARPKNTTQERQTFLTHFSETVSRNLVPYFDAWGIEVDDETRARLEPLPDWMPQPPDGAEVDGNPES